VLLPCCPTLEPRVRSIFTSGGVVVRRNFALLALTAAACSGTLTGLTLGSRAIVVGNGFEAALSGSKVVWAPYTQSGTPVYVMDLSTGTRDTVVAAGGPTEPYYPSIDGTAIVWVSFTVDTAGQTQSRIALGDLEGAPPRYLTSGLSIVGFPKISGSHVVWQEQQPNLTDWNVVVYDTLTGDTTLVVSGPEAFPGPAIDGDNVVYSHLVGRTSGGSPISCIRLFNLTTRETQTLSPDSGAEGNVAISGDGVVWVDHSDSTSDIMYRNIATGAIINITKNRGNAGFPSISGERIVWEDHRNGDSDIYLYDLSTGQETRVTDAPGDQVTPSISRNWIVWVDKHAPWRIMADRVPTAASSTP